MSSSVSSDGRLVIASTSISFIPSLKNGFQLLLSAFSTFCLMSFSVKVSSSSSAKEMVWFRSEAVNGIQLCEFPGKFLIHVGRCLVLLLRIRSAHLEILRFSMGGAY